ncbi:hypothetical protein R3P38DRAFT_3259230 [Favolaschia claudopus]|uniref:Uncharacterized protein n=1 Tax=Favolaschia claudopus TaxID=2862362 RepID=A0AAW0D2X7_9AGAR
MQFLAALLRLLPLSLAPLTPPEQSNTLSTTAFDGEDGSDLCIDFPALYQEPKCCKELLPGSLPSIQCTSPSYGTTPQSFRYVCNVMAKKAGCCREDIGRPDTWMCWQY